MKNLFTILVILSLSSSLLAQNNETKYKSSNYTPLRYPSFEFSPELARPIVYNEVLGQFIKLNAEPNLIMFPVHRTGGFVQVLGSIHNSKIQFMNFDLEVQYLYDNNGVLRESGFYLPLGKKKWSHSIRYINTQ